MSKKTVYSILIISSAIILVIAVYQMRKDNDTQVMTLQKTEKGIDRIELSQDEKNQLIRMRPEVEPVKNEQRSPASLKNHPLYADRAIVGDHPDALERPAINHFETNWQEKLVQSLLKFQPEGTKLVVKNEKSLVQVKREESRLVQQVVISFVNLKGRQSSYRAFVDSETGEIVHTWDRIIHENINQKPLTFSQSGTL